jgi:uncharacterized tellurite resistance protein B-like protein
MSDPFRSFFTNKMHIPSDKPNGQSESGGTPPDSRQKLHVAACALLLELAHADDEFSEAERLHIEAVVRRHLGLDNDTARALMELAEEERTAAADVYQFTSLIRDSYDDGQKTLLAEIMWGVILADGQIERHEGRLRRKIASLLDLQPGYLAEAKRRAATDVH